MCADFITISWMDEAGESRSDVAILDDISENGACIGLDCAIPEETKVSLDHPKGRYEGKIKSPACSTSTSWVSSSCRRSVLNRASPPRFCAVNPSIRYTSLMARIAVVRGDGFLALQLLEQQQRQEGHAPAVAIVELETGDPAIGRLERLDQSALRKCMQHALFVSGNVHLV